MIFDTFQLFLEEMKTYVKYQTITKTSKFGKISDTYSALFNCCQAQLIFLNLLSTPSNLVETNYQPFLSA
jgi:hypothetical protein